MSDPCNDNCQSNKIASAPTSGIANTDTAFQHGYVSDYRVPKMDCPSEEGMIRMALDSIEPRVLLEFDTPNRKVRVFHGDNGAAIEERMRSLGLGAPLEKTTPGGEGTAGRASAAVALSLRQARPLQEQNRTKPRTT